MGVPLAAMSRQYLGIALNQARKTGAVKDALADTSGTSLLGQADAEGSPLLGTTTNGGGTATATETATFYVPVPARWQPSSFLGVAIRAKVSTARTVSAQVDLVAKLAGDSLGSDICATAAQDLTTAYKWFLFQITGTSLIPGSSVLALTVSLAQDDTGGASNGAASITEVRWEFEGYA